MYIRTKDGVYEVSEYEPSEYTTLISNPVKAFDVKVTTRTSNGSSIRIVYGSEVISQSESIEELCDEFVVFDKEQPNGKLLYYKGFENLKKEFIDFEKDKEKVVVYGAIWTDKGLIYVAKMNDKGELELIWN